MERRVLLAIALSIGLIFLVNVLFPPVAPPPSEVLPGDTAAVASDGPGALAGRPDRPGTGDRPAAAGGAGGAEVADGQPDSDDRLVGGADSADRAAAAAPAEADTVLVRSELYEYALSTRGAALVGARLLSFDAYRDDDAETTPVDLVPEGGQFFAYGIAVGGDTVRVTDRAFIPSARRLDLSPSNPRDSISFVHDFSGRAGRFVVTYHFRHDGYLVDVTGRVEGLRDRGYVLLASLGRGLRSNEKNRSEDYDQYSMVTNGEENHVETVKFKDVEAGEVRQTPGGPFHWVGVKSKYFLLAAIAPTEGPLFGGASIAGGAEEHEAEVTTSLPVPAGSGGFRFSAYLGPQDYGRLNTIGQDLQDVNAYGYRWLQPVTRPLVAIVMPILVWMHTRFDLAYGWVLILFGVLMRIILFPLYQKSMRAQIGQMRVQPIVQEIREKHKDDPQKLQQEMMRVYKEEGVNPLAGCLPMLVPMPILFTLFFVFQGTIEFRGVPFLWLPDLSLKDPLYIIPLIMGASMFLLQWIGQRGMNVVNTQMKVMMYAMPIFFTFLFANFPSGLNLYYTTSNLASLPQQLYIARERLAAGVGGSSKAKSGATNDAEPDG
ncbi:MAG: membrane protein insertase YidC [Gemmatimonadota bacterium]